VPELAFFPAMRRPVKEKLREIAEHLESFCRHFQGVSVGEHADALLGDRLGSAGRPEEPAALLGAPR